MRETSCKIVMNLTNEDARDSSVLMDDNVLIFSNIDNVKNDNNTVLNYGTFELNQFVLDGTKSIMPNDLTQTNYAIVSSELSDADCVILEAEKPCISITFPSSVTTNGFAFSFKDAFPQKIRIRWYDSSDTLVSDMNFLPDGANLFNCVNRIKNFKRAEICFFNTNFPYHRIKLENMDFGIKIINGNEQISSAKVLEELNMISSEISINKLNFSLFNADSDFNILNPKGFYQYIETGVKVDVYESLNGTSYNMGSFYLDRFTSENENEISFDCIDGIGRISKTNFKKGRIYTGQTVNEVIGDIMTSADFSKYEIQEDLKTIQVYGYIPVCTHREALQQVCFAIRAVADCSRSDKIKIYRISTTPEARINQNRVFMDGSAVKMKETISDISITTHKYTKDSESSTVFEGNLSAGINEIEFTDPTSDLVVNGATIIDSGLNFVRLNVASYGNVVVSGKVYKDVRTVYNKSYDGLKNNTLKISDATLVTTENINLVLENVFNYYGLRKEAEQEFILETEKVGKWYNLVSNLGYIVSGGIESQSIDLVNGFLSTSKLVGYNAFNSDIFYTGLERYTGEQIGVI